MNYLLEKLGKYKKYFFEIIIGFLIFLTLDLTIIERLPENTNISITQIIQVIKKFLESDFFSSLITGFISSAFVVLFGVQSLKDYIKKIEESKEIGMLQSFWDSSSLIFYIVFGVESTQNNDEIEPRFGYAQAIGLSRITSILRRIYGKKITINIVPLLPEDKIPKKCFEQNIIIMGGEYSLNIFRELNIGLKVPFYQYELQSDNRYFCRKENEVILDTLKSNIDINKKLVKRDLGTIIRIKNLKNKNLIILYNGNYSAGLCASILTTVNYNNFQESQFKPSINAQQLIVSVKDIPSTNIISIDHPVQTFLPWMEFPINNDDLQKIIDNITIDNNDNQYSELIHPSDEN